VGSFVANGSNDGAFDPAHDMGGVVETPDFFQDGGFVFLRGFGFENDDHRVWMDGWVRAAKTPTAQQKSRRLWACGERERYETHEPTRQQAGL
jgi:hypothetical protein